MTTPTSPHPAAGPAPVPPAHSGGGAGASIAAGTGEVPGHIPVLPSEVLAALGLADGAASKPNLVYADCTAGLGGHAALVAQRLGPGGTVALADLDPGNLAHAAARLHALPQPPVVRTVPGNFAALPHALRSAGLAADLVLADLGFASPQVDDPARGLSFSKDGPLDMRLDPSSPRTAATLVATLPERELADLIREYGEERHAILVARAIVAARKAVPAAPLTTTAALAAVVRSALRGKYDPGGIDPATRTFQALRIAVNDELGNLAALLDAIADAAADQASGRPTWLRPGARIAIISFHSLEDRPVKQAFAALVSRGRAIDLLDGPVGPTPAEVAANPRARSAKLRAIALTPPAPRPQPGPT
ncbi:MAG: 16S rRNA (cytosine(1402)-N(4))-methyltransferase RsmH [Planctomycetaceae bacterium]|nr:16S rRNA (cytosine(1402)-N(4))-methyltransferase RsmH [Planctomycetaceae bacterium]